jgi:hypothetical protein
MVAPAKILTMQKEYPQLMLGLQFQVELPIMN